MPKKHVSIHLTASSLRLVLLVSVLLVVLLQVGLIFLGQNLITKYGQQVAQAVSVTQSNTKTLSDLEAVNTTLRTQEKTVTKAHGVVADKDNPYAYQNQIIEDITAYAKQAGVTITGYTFADEAAAPGATGAAATAPASAATTGAAAATAAVPASVSPITVTLAIAPGMSYDSLYKFLQLLEGNLLRLEVQGLTLARTSAQEGGGNYVSLSSLTIQAYKRK